MIFENRAREGGHAFSIAEKSAHSRVLGRPARRPALPAGSGGRPRARESVSQERSDPLDGIEIAPVRDRPDSSTMSERLVHSEVEPVLALVHPSAVERTGAPPCRNAAAGGALPGRPIGSVLEEQLVDAPIRSRLERRRPTARGSAVPPGLLAPTLDRFLLLCSAPLLEHRRHDLEQLRGRGMCFRDRPADHGLPNVVRKRLLEFRPRLLGADDDDPREMALAELTLELFGDLTQVPLGELLDVALVARL